VFLLCFGLASCATGVDSGSDVTGPVDAGLRADAASLEGGSNDAAATVDTGSAGSMGGDDGGEPDDAGGTETGTPEAGPADAGTGVDAGAASDAGGDTGATDSGCAGHGTTGVLVTFDLSSQSGSETSAAATTSAAGIASGTTLSRASALTAVSGSGSINSSGWPTSATATSTDYYTLTVTPAAGCSVTLGSIALDVKASSTGPAKGDVATSADSFGTHTASFTGTATPTVTLTGVTGTGPIEVRFYGYAATGSSGTFRIENTLTLSGSIE
jgi:hypothetical protein